MPSDPLSEAREALRAVFEELDDDGRIDTKFNWPEYHRLLARLDALPAPQRITAWAHDGWFYPDAPSDDNPPPPGGEHAAR